MTPKHTQRLLIALSCCSPCAFVWAAPTGGQVVSGTAVITTPTQNDTTINQTSQNVAIDWDSFNIGSSESVNFIQPNASAIALNRDFSGSPSQILGNLSANGNVFLLNTAGVLIGSGANVNVGSLLISDMAISNEDAQNFEVLASTQNWSMPFTDSELQAGGIEVLGSVTTNGSQGITMMGQYIYIEGSVTSLGAANDPGGNIQFVSAGSTVLVTDPNGLYGVEITGPVTQLLPGHSALFEIPESATSASVTALNGNISIDVVYEADLNIDPGSPGLNRPGIRFNTQAISSPGDGGQPIAIRSTAIDLPNDVSTDQVDDINDTITESLTEDSDESGTSYEGDSDGTTGSLDNLMQSCQPKDQNDKECIKKNAIKRYLGKLLIGGSLPE